MININNIYREISVFLILLQIIALNGCKTAENNNTNISKLSAYGNMYNYNLATATEYGTYYMVENNGSSTLFKADEDLKNQISIAEEIKMFFPIESYIYFTKGDSVGLYRTSYNGGDSIKISELSCDELVSSSNKLYFSNNTSKDTNGLYSMNRDGSDLKKLLSGNVFNLQINNNSLYYGLDIAAGGSEIYRMDMDTLKTERVGTASEVYRFFIYNETLYYQDINDLYSLDMVKNIVSKITQGAMISTDSMNVYGNYLIYSAVANESCTYALNMDTGKSRKISDNYYQYVLVIGKALLTNKGIVVPSI